MANDALHAERESAGGLWRNTAFAKLFAAHSISLFGAALTSVALGLLAHQLVGAGVATVMGITLTIRIAVVVFLSPFAGHVAERVGPKPAMILSDILRAGIVIGFFLATAVWHIYLLAFFLNLASAVFTPIYKSCIPNIVTAKQYPRALSFGSIAYDAANIAGPMMAGLFIAWFGFRGNFLLNAAAFLLSAALILSVRLTQSPAPVKNGERPRLHGIRAMIRRPGLLRSLFLSARVAVISGFVLVATVHYVKNTLELPDAYYAWALLPYGIGSILGALLYGQLPAGNVRRFIQAVVPWGAFAGFIIVATTATFPWLAAGWLIAGAGQVVLGIHGNELLALNSDPEERSHIYSAHFALSHLGWGFTYPLAGWSTTTFGFNAAALGFAGLFVAVAIAERSYFRRNGTTFRPH